MDQITVRRDMHGGAPCIRGLPITVVEVVRLIAEGATHEAILARYPDLVPGDIPAAVHYAADVLGNMVWSTLLPPKP